MKIGILRAKPFLAFLAVLFLAGLGLRIPPIAGHALHYDEPFWMLRGDFLIEHLARADWQALQTRFWNVKQVQDGRPLYDHRMASGTPVALVAGLSRLVLLTPQSEPRFEIAASRLPLALISAIAAALLVWLARWAGLGWRASICWGIFLLLDPVLRTYASIIHMEAVLTVFMWASILLAEKARRTDSWALTALSGALFGVAFSTRVNAAAAPLAVSLFFFLRTWAEAGRAWDRISVMLRNGGRLILYGTAGAAVFALLFPPIWPNPLSGLADFLRQYSGGDGHGDLFAVFQASFPTSMLPVGYLFAVAGLLGMLLPEVRRNRFFQLGWIVYLTGCILLSQGVTGANSRYLSSLMPGLGLAGAAALGSAWQRWVPSPSRARQIGAAAVCLALLTATMGWREWHRAGQITTFYEKLSQQRYGRVLALQAGREFRRLQEGSSRRPSLFIASPAWHVPLLYLGVGLSDRRRMINLAPGWQRLEIQADGPCGPQDWLLSENQNEDLREPIRLYSLIAGRCTQSQ